MFARLHSNGKAHSLKYTKRVLEKAFKKPFDDIFIEFDPKPMGIGAIAQVSYTLSHFVICADVNLPSLFRHTKVPSIQI